SWNGWGPLQLLGADVSGGTLGLVGMGRIGRAMAKRASGFDMRILYWNRTRLETADEKILGVEYVELDELLAHSDFLSLHVALTPETEHLIGAAEFAKMKSTSILVNTARGPVVDEQALVAALQTNSIAGAGLDVYEHEPALAAELYDFESVVVAPHLGSATIGTRTKMGNMAANNCLSACRGTRPANLVNPEIYV
ncbi:MAG: D-glycerate dehydrogenase, partial [Planctomycetaceae bacterium]|nr:D-glycerate dehydrogenase [Planctomycetaceae bacterium]